MTGSLNRTNTHVGQKCLYVAENGWKDSFHYEIGEVTEVRESTVILLNGRDERWTAWFDELRLIERPILLTTEQLDAIEDALREHMFELNPMSEEQRKIEMQLSDALETIKKQRSKE